MYLPRPSVKETSENIQNPQNISCCISLHGSPKYGLTLGLTRKSIPPPWYKGGGGVNGTLPQSF